MTDDLTPTRAPGRPSDFSEELAAEIIELLADGGSLREICRMPGMPNVRTVHRWKLRHPEFAGDYNAARELGATALAEEALEVARNTTSATVQADRLTWDGLRWHAGRLSGKWNDKIVHEHTGEATLRLQAMQAPLVPREVAAGIKALLDKAEATAGLPPGDGTDAERLKTIMASGEPLDPDLYEAIHGG